MKIVIGTVQVPFVIGGAEFLAKNLQLALCEAGHEAEIVTMPFMDNPLSQIEDHIVAARLMNQEWSWGGRADLFIGLKFPAYYMPHPNKVVWALHQHRAAYDLFNTEFSNIKDTVDGRKVRRIIMRADNTYLKESKRIYTIAKNVADRMQIYNGIEAQSLYHPCPDMNKFYQGTYENYILMPSRINITKRQILALEAFCHSKSDIKLYIVGKAEADYERRRMLDFIRERHLDKRVKYFDYVAQEEKFRLYANARAVLFIPCDEDYGYITLEAMAAGKAVITAQDSGGPLEFVQDGRNGIIAEPTPHSIAQAIDQLAENKNLAIQYGENAAKHLKGMNITWENVVKELTKSE
ncbi:MAG: glycosyltransferase family 4 protein [Oscillospiraceae bacterium]|jgi:glycosyltransferase involved in cell wall biosynthesis|nr:glycosyltransferase family 4 protein [Oscillospiraceae bacterium]